MDDLNLDLEKLKQEIVYFERELNSIKQDIFKNQEIILKMFEIIKGNQKKLEDLTKTQFKDITTQKTPSSTHNLALEGLKHQNIHISTGNEGVPTDRQTDRQTDNKPTEQPFKMEKALEILNSLDNIKKEIRLKFKRLTNQEMLVFSALYQLEQEKVNITYKDLSVKLNLSESSIRDYIGRLIKKEIPVEKIKINNKTITLKVSENLKKIASINTILQLREL